MRQFLLASAMVLAAPFIAGEAWATPTLQIAMQSGGVTKSQSAAFGSGGGSHSFDGIEIGDFTASNIGTQIYSSSYIDLATVDLSSKKGGTLTITVTGAGFTSKPGMSNWLTQFTGNLFDVTQGRDKAPSDSNTVSVKTFLDKGNKLDNPGCATGCTLLSSVNMNGGSAIATASPDGLFALTEVITITTKGAQGFSLDASLGAVPATSVPEPMSLALLGTGLLGLGVVRRSPRRAA